VLLVVTDERCIGHEAGTNHPERPDRLLAATAGLAESGVTDALVHEVPRLVTDAELLRVHDATMVAHIVAVGEAGGGRIDADTVMNAASLEAARLAAGSVVTAVDRLIEDTGSFAAAYCVVRPPGHHATPSQSMGFCLFNSVAVAAAALAEAGERVAIVDIDAHHGNGTQDIFFSDPRVLFTSIHQSPLYPGTGGLHEVGAGRGVGTTINVPVPPGATGDVARAAIDRVIGPAIERFGATWVLISAGYDGHRSDPITDLGYSSADIAELVGAITPLVGRGRVVTVLEGGYDLDAIRHSSAAVTAQLVGESWRPESATSGGPGMDIVDAAAQIHAAS
jgi:acetoin utilization deacetylase AcuC-like enzyme